MRNNLMFAKSQDVERRILEGEKLNVKELAEEYYGDEDKEVGISRVYSMVGNIRERLMAEGTILTPVSDGFFGIPQSKQEVSYAHDYYRRRVERNVKNVMFLHEFAKRKNILPDGFRNKTIMLPVFGGGDKA